MAKFTFFTLYRTFETSQMPGGIENKAVAQSIYQVLIFSRSILAQCISFRIILVQVKPVVQYKESVLP
jgi:hypothetical protein